MRCHDSRRATLHGPWPTAAEQLAAKFADDYEIYREVGPDGIHGDWIALHWPTDGQQESEREKLQAASIEDLCELLGGQS